MHMKFTHPKVIEYIINNYNKATPLRVATIRSHYYIEGMRVKVYVCEYGIGDAIVVKTDKLRNAVLYVKYSGFDSVDEWISEAKRLHSGGYPHTSNANRYKRNLQVVVIDIVDFRVSRHAIC